MPEALLPTPPGFNDLSKADQVRYLQDLWDQISEDPRNLPVPESHLRLAEERLFGVSGRRPKRHPQITLITQIQKR